MNTLFIIPYCQIVHKTHKGVDSFFFIGKLHMHQWVLNPWPHPPEHLQQEEVPIEQELISTRE